MNDTITFEFVDPDVEEGEYYSAEEPSPYFGLTQEKMDKNLRFLQNSNVVVINKPVIKVRFNYPLSDEHIIPLIPCDGKRYFTRETLGKTIALKYQEIYTDEEKTTELPVESIAEQTSTGGRREIPLMNRATTNGVWGIWGHDLSDLDLHTVSYDKETDTYSLGIDS